MDKHYTRLQDGLLAGGSCFIAGSSVAQESMQQAAQDVNAQANPVITQIVIPIITGIIAPILKELAIEWRDKIRERRKRRKAIKQTVSEQ